MIVISITQLRRNWSKCFDLCQYEDIHITRQGKAVCILRGMLEESERATLRPKEELLRAIMGAPQE